MTDQQELDGMPADQLKLRVSYGGMQIATDQEPQLRDPIFLAVAGHISAIKEPPGDEDTYLLVTVKGDAKQISQAQYAELIS